MSMKRAAPPGFTLIELLVVLAIIAVLMSLAVPQYIGRVEMAKEAVLRENLHQMRAAIDKYYGDNNRYPEVLGDLVTRKYLRRIPPDPLTESDQTWVIVVPAEPRKGRVFDVRSGAAGKGRDGTSYDSW